MKTITRKELYDKIWSITKSKTAEELGLPIAYLTKICGEHNIPTPTSGYWQHLSWGRDVEKTPLPNPDVDTTIVLMPNEPVSKVRKKKVQQTNYSEILDIEISKTQEENECKHLRRCARAGKFVVDFNKPVDSWGTDVDKVVRIFPVSDVLKTRRDIVLQTKAYLRLKRLSGYEQMQHPDYNRLQTHLDISTELESNDRALRLFDAIINIYEALGGKMRYDKNCTFIEMGDVEISIRISERSKRVELSEEEQRYGGKYKFIPSGLFRVSLWSGPYESMIEDTKFAKVEDKLDILVRKSLTLVQNVLDWREQIRLQEIERRRQEEERRRAEERRKQIEKLREQELNNARGMLSLLKREMIVSLIDIVLNRYDSSDVSDYESDALAIKLRSLQNMFDPNRTAPIESNLTESDINLLANEFFAG